MTKYTKISISIIILALLAGFIAGILYNNPQKIIVPKFITDTTYVDIIRPPIIVESKAKLIYRTKHDTIILNDTIISHKDSLGYQMPAYTACLDTIINGDTIKAEYMYPENNFWLAFMPKPDSIPQIFITKEIEKERPWWEIPAYIAGSLMLGYLIGGKN